MDGQDPRPLNPISFLQAFIVQGIRVAELGCAECGGSSDHVSQVGLATSGCLEEVARRLLGCTGPVDPDQYAELIIDIKNRIGGQFERARARRAACVWSTTVVRSATWSRRPRSCAA